MNVFVLTEGGKKIGFGHIARCLSLCQAFEEFGTVPEFIVNGDETIKDLLSDRKYLSLNWIEDIKVLDVLQGADIVVIDSYMADLRIYLKVCDAVKISVYLDDNKRLDYPAGIVINGGIDAEMLGYIKREGISYLLGPGYAPLRKAFWDVTEKEIRENIGTIMVTFGGDDIRNLTPGVLELLVDEYPGVCKEIVIGKGFSNSVRIKAAADKNTRLHYNLDAEAMLGLMLGSDVAISAGGQTLYELARVGVPAIAIAVADNQINNIKGWQHAGCIEYAGWWEDGGVFNKMANSLKTVKGQDVRTKLSQTGRYLVDGRGAKRAVGYIVNGVYNKLI